MTNDLVDTYSDGFLGQPTANSEDDPTRQWSGSDSRRRFFSISDLFDLTKLPKAGPGDQFTDKLLKASTRPSTYDRYTFYQMLSQIGMDSTPEEPGKINLNNVREANTLRAVTTNDLLFGQHLLLRKGKRNYVVVTAR